MKTHISNSLLSAPALMFMMCCDMRNFSAVANALGITQSSVSKTMQKFEREIGLQLFIRNSRPLALTPEARLLHKNLRSLKGEMLRSLSTLQSKNYIKPILRVGILESLHLHLGFEIIKQTLLYHSQITMISASANVLLQRLIERKLDLIITNVATSDALHIFTKRIFTEPSVLILPKTFALEDDHEWTWQRLAVCGLPLVKYWNETGAGEINETFLRMHGLSFPDRISVDTNALMVKLISEGIGWGFSRPTTVLQNLHFLPHLAIRPMQPPTFSREVFIIGREQEFILESEILYSLSTHYLQRQLIPQILDFAPWVKDGFQVG
ncbi:LysR family transcriptional regulator [uncultured Parasutterella sp.]|uniref:LysR family transcriptional regulator n=2 Tax=uncultured Parasutterella sp. TaxID=1263098 RepID=UPI0025B690C0|nr:LysR family transcriptional regulator [uncultured Parasutterella sp.]